MYAFSRTSHRAVLAALAAAAAFAALPAAGTTSTHTGDPRVCATATAGGPTRHAYWCAKAAATDAVRKTMAARQHVARWFYPVFCDERGSLLRWSCTTVRAGTSWHAAVVFAKTATGWRPKVTVTA